MQAAARGDAKQRAEEISAALEDETELQPGAQPTGLPRSAAPLHPAAPGSILVPAQRTMSKRAGSTVAEVAGSHAIYVLQPKSVAAFIAKAATDVAAKSN